MMLSRSLLVFLFVLLALAVASDVKGSSESGPADEDGLPTVPALPLDGEPKGAKHPKEPKKHKEKKHPHPKEKHEKKHKDPKDKHPKEDEPVAAAAPPAEEAAPEPDAAPAEQGGDEEVKPAASATKTRRAAHSFPANKTDAAVEEEAQNAACGTCCGVDMGDMASKLPFINRK